MIVPLKRRPKSQYGERTVFNLITQFDVNKKKPHWHLALPVFKTNRKWTVMTLQSTENLLLDCLCTCGKWLIRNITITGHLSCNWIEQLDYTFKLNVLRDKYCNNYCDIWIQTECERNSKHFNKMNVHWYNDDNKLIWLFLSFNQVKTFVDSCLSSGGQLEI